MPAQYLDVSPEAIREVLALGGQQDAIGRVYVPAGVDLVPFAVWLASGRSAVMTLADRPGISLETLLARCAAALKTVLPEPVWVRIEISQIRASGRQVAKSQAIIWSSLVTRLVKKFSSATGMELGKGIQVLVLAKPEIHPQYGLSLQITDIDPAFTLGDMAARLKKIREDLAACGDARRNIELPTPDDFVRVGVVSPAAAAGLEDFQAGAAVLASAGLCSFTYFEAIFQGEKAKESIKAALIAAHAANQQAPFGALVIIRGGGATADLHWLDEFVLARMVCRFHAPVFTGIGHERDRSVLDQCANRSFGTASKVIAHIRAAIVAKASKGQENWTTITHSISTALTGASVRSGTRLSEIGAGTEPARVMLQLTPFSVAPGQYNP